MSVVRFDDERRSAARWMPTSDVVRCGAATDSVTLVVNDGILDIRLEHEPRGEDLVRCLQRALDAGLMKYSMPTLVDLTNFRGQIDWSAIYAVQRMAPWGTGARGQSRVAYVSRDSMFKLVMKLIVGLFPYTRHRLFADEPEARDWLASHRV